VQEGTPLAFASSLQFAHDFGLSLLPGPVCRVFCGDSAAKSEVVPANPYVPCKAADVVLLFLKDIHGAAALAGALIAAVLIVFGRGGHRKSVMTFD
jgi:hypothetical protein